MSVPKQFMLKLIVCREGSEARAADSLHAYMNTIKNLYRRTMHLVSLQINTQQKTANA